MTKDQIAAIAADSGCTPRTILAVALGVEGTRPASRKRVVQSAHRLGIALPTPAPVPTGSEAR